MICTSGYTYNDTEIKIFRNLFISLTDLEELLVLNFQSCHPCMNEVYSLLRKKDSEVFCAHVHINTQTLKIFEMH